MDDCIVISDNESTDESIHVTSDLTSLGEDQLINSRPGAISKLANLLENDCNNFPDSLGRVLLNPTHGQDECDIYLAFHIGKQLKPHQISGIRFMFSNLIGSIPHFNAGLSGAGCILAHSMGLGKTLQVVTFLEALFRCSKLHRCLIVTPANTVRIWHSEFNKWLPEPPLDICNKVENNENLLEIVDIDGDDRYRKFQLLYIDDENKCFEDKLSLLDKWTTGGGVLLIGYEMLLSIFKNAEKRIKSSLRKPPTGGYVHMRKKPTDSVEERRMITEAQKKEFQIVRNAFLMPDMVVCDEGHRLKSESTEIVQLMKKIRTKRKLVLTGYPLQNNLMEYWFMVDFVRPGHLGLPIQFKDLFVIPIQRGSAADSVAAEVALMRQRTHILYSLLKGFVHRRPALLLYQHLPPKYEYILSLKMTPFQARVYNACVASSPFTNYGPYNRNLFRSFALAMKISNHPDVFHRFVLSRANAAKEDNEDDELWSDEEGFIDDKPRKSFNQNNRKRASPFRSPLSRSPSQKNDNGKCSEWSDWLNTAKMAGYREDRDAEDVEGYYNMKWALPLLEDYSPKSNPVDSPKFRVLMCLIKHAVLAGDRMLIFSQNLSTLDLIEKILQSTIKPHAVLPSSFDDSWRSEENCWQPNVDYYRFDGSTPGSSRSVLVNRFQQSAKQRGDHVKTENGITEEKTTIVNNTAVLFLISTRAGSLGITLTGANRVCLMDASWNPCQDVQALARVYRFGQLKPCFIYRLVSDCSLERVVYDRQVHKEALSTRVVDDSPVNRKFSRDDIKNLFRAYPEDSTVEETIPEDSKAKAESLIASFNSPVVDTVLNSVLRELPFLFARTPQRHDTFREIDPAQRLSDQERRRALLQYELEKSEYESTLLPTFSKNGRSGSKKSRSSIAVNDESTSGLKPQLPAALPHQASRMSSERLLSSLNTPTSSQPSASSILSSVLTGNIIPPPSAASVPPIPPSTHSSPIPLAEISDSSQPALPFLPAPSLLPVPHVPEPPPVLPIPSALPLYNLPSMSKTSSSRLPAPPGFTSSAFAPIPLAPPPVRQVVEGPRGPPPPVMPLVSEIKPIPVVPCSADDVIEISDDDD